MIDFKFEVGKFYKTRDGRKVECVKIYCDGIYKNVITYVRVAMPSVYIVDDSGYLFDDKEITGSDIVGIWEEPKPKRLCFINTSNGALHLMEDNRTDPYFISGSLERFPCALDET